MTQLQPGDPAPTFTVRSPAQPRFVFETVAGRVVVLCFLGSAARPELKAVHDGFLARTDLFDDDRAAYFAVSGDPGDESAARLANRIPGFRAFWDFDRAVARAYGLVAGGGADGRVSMSACTFVLDARLRVLAVFPIVDPVRHASDVCAFVAALPRAEAAPGAPAPILVVPRLFEPEFCRRLIAYYERTGGAESGFMQSDEQGRTVLRVDHAHKRRRDCLIEDEALRDGVRARIHRRLVPEIARAFQFRATRIERYIVARYDAGEGGYFRPHRDNTTKGTAHRRFAVTVNLNAEEYEGGDLRFPEFGRATFRAPSGGAIVFSCSLLHEATPMIRGRRYAVLPFLYDDAAAKLRAENLRFVADETLRDGIAGSLGKVP